MAIFRECRFLSQDGRSLYYRDYGDPSAGASPVLCLPGLTRNSKDFHALASRLAASHRVICPDYRGRGQSERDPDPANYHPQVTLGDLRHLMIVTGLDEAILVCTSYGGFMAMGLAVLAPSSLRAMILNDVGPEVSEQGMRRISGYVGKDSPQPDWDAAIAELQRMFPEMADDDPATLRDEAEATWRAGNDGLLHFDWDTRLAAAVLEARTESDPWVLFRALSQFPVLALRGERSDVLSAETLRRMVQAHPDIEAVTVSGRGHPLTLNEPEVTEAIDAFLARV
ncbi:MAG: alpha/beta hydrolase [Rhodospirillales bacterium]|nr:MAG: alpha/beta hydrolase [Rhodospirillales bacterium]